jgi:hypothetical protein
MLYVIFSHSFTFIGGSVLVFGNVMSTFFKLMPNTAFPETRSSRAPLKL